MDSLINMLPLFKILFVFICMLIGIRFKLGVGLSVLIGGFVLALVTDMKMDALLQTVQSAVTDEKTIYLALIVALIMLLSGLLERTGQAGRIMDSLTGYLKSPRLRLVFFPALIGLLPMPGGAIFSAPMIREAAEGLDVTDKDKVVINYWFRHVWELAWPLYPGMLLGAALSGMPVFKFISYTAPGSLACILLGYFFFLRPSILPLKNGVHDNVEIKPGSALIAVKEGMPLLLAIGGALCFEGVFSLISPNIPFEAGIVVALFLAVICAAFSNSGSFAIICSLLVQKRFISMIFLILCVFIFKDVLGDCGLVGELSRLAGGEAALIAAAVFVPFLIGFIAGITMAFVGAAMPLVVGLVDSMGITSQLPAWAMLCMFSGFAGLMASPLHICFLLTCEYFKVDLFSAWKRIVVPSLALLCLGVAYFFVLV
ncbi:hypothetical protein SAMN05660337_3070 [Maridesulfovibrio ferrireducens]|uniref:DUF401 family protein n=1 Tax=Maridesulfovibrio ferrireducens TaxID=246191 RepID=A0A1G9KGN1_9BACT|nr:DUF401 family protein [Maridesulfovibrio ferrireducens]SDL48694.1 hypothetical protein SAMN05660337_3070 [Maridesulfovibrio ferrireducens]